MEKRGVEYSEYDVQNDPVKLDEMLKLNGGQRRVPTIVTDGKTSIGFNGS
jgi:glutaredoxin